MATDVKAASGGDNLPARMAAWPARAKEYILDLQAEMRRVTWPSWKQVRSTTGVVIAAVFAFAAYFWVVDLFFTRVMKRIFDTFTT